MPEKPKALSPSIAITCLPVTTAAATAKPMPMPMMPQVPTSRRLRGLYMSTMLRVKSSALAPSLTRIASGLRLDDVAHHVERAVEVHRRRVLRQRLGHLGEVLVLALGDRAGPLGRRLGPAGADAASAAPTTHEPMSPTTGASMRTLLSASCGEMSIWMNFWPPQSLWPLPPQVLPLPCDSSQLRRAPISITTSASGST